jgi:hypothetical protein
VSAEPGFDCPEYHECPFPMMTHWQRCAPGFYSKQTSSHTGDDAYYSCQPCPEGQYCLNKGETATGVGNGYYSPFGFHMHYVVPAGFMGSTTQPLRPCAPGEYSPDSSAVCIQSSPGRVATFTSNEETMCPEGRYSGGNEFLCDPCAVDEIYDFSDDTCKQVSDGSGSPHPMYSQVECPYGYYSDSTSITSNNQRDCLPCTSGMFCAVGETTAAPTGQ